MRKKAVFFSVGSLIFVAIVIALWATPSLNDNKVFEKSASIKQDSTILHNDRQCGNVNLNKFIALASGKPRNVFDPSHHIRRTEDSITFSTSLPSIFFGQDNGKWWKSRYKNLPISFPDNNSFTAAVCKKDSIEYIYIPYEILMCLANSFQGGLINVNNIHPNETIGQEEEPSPFTVRPEHLQSLSDNQSKIQTGGIVFDHVAEVLHKNGGQNQNSRDQLEILWLYARKHWLYINDPFAPADTWRSASETINAYYTNSTFGYSGDCDDFAILMASFARQIGFDSHVVVVMGAQGGHAYAEFKNGERWIPLDWFSNRFGGAPYAGTIYKVYRDI